MAWNNQVSECPPSSAVGTAELRVAGVSGALNGNVFVGTPVSGKARLFLVAEGGGLELKLPGTLEQLPSERLNFTFGNQPKLPREPKSTSPSLPDRSDAGSLRQLHGGIESPRGTQASRPKKLNRPIRSQAAPPEDSA